MCFLPSCVCKFCFLFYGTLRMFCMCVCFNELYIIPAGWSGSSACSKWCVCCGLCKHNFTSSILSYWLGPLPRTDSGNNSVGWNFCWPACGSHVESRVVQIFAMDVPLVSNKSHCLIVYTCRKSGWHNLLTHRLILKCVTHLLC